MTTQKLTHDEKFELDSYLNNFIKNSRHINGMLDNQRMAIAQAFAIIISALVKHDSSLLPVLISAVTEIESKTFSSASLDGERSLIARAIREDLARTSDVHEKFAPHSKTQIQLKPEDQIRGKTPKAFAPHNRATQKLDF